MQHCHRAFRLVSSLEAAAAVKDNMLSMGAVITNHKKMKTIRFSLVYYVLFLGYAQKKAIRKPPIIIFYYICCSLVNRFLFNVSWLRLLEYQKALEKVSQFAQKLVSGIFTKLGDGPPNTGDTLF